MESTSNVISPFSSTRRVTSLTSEPLGIATEPSVSRISSSICAENVCPSVLRRHLENRFARWSSRQLPYLREERPAPCAIVRNRGFLDICCHFCCLDFCRRRGLRGRRFGPSIVA